MRTLLLLFSSILLCLNSYADDSFSRANQAYSNAVPFMTEYQVLDEIERLKEELDQLTQVGRISSSTALAVSATLATIAYGVTFSGLSVLFGDLDVKMVLAGAVASVFPGLGVGVLLGAENSAPSVPIGESFWLSFRSAISSTGLWMAGNGFSYGINRFFDALNYSKNTMFWSGVVMIPVHTYILYYNIVNRLEEKKGKVFDVEFQLNEARRYLDQQFPME